MTNEGVVAVLVRVLGIVLGLNGLQALSVFFAMMYSEGGARPGWALAAYAVVNVFWLVVAVALIWRPMSIAANVVPAAARDDAASRWTADDLLAVAFSALGAWVLYGALLTSLAMFRAWAFFSDLSSGSARVSPGPFNAVEIGTLILRVGIGLWLLLGAGGLRRLIRKAHGADAASAG